MSKLRTMKVCVVCFSKYFRRLGSSRNEWNKQVACSIECGRRVGKKSLAQRLQERSAIEPNTGCIIWLGAERRGYGRIWCSDERRNKSAHRVAYELLRGPVPDGHEIDHVCRTRLCVNPEHLEVVTGAENIRRGLPFRTYVRTECPNGHPYGNTPAGARGTRRCGVCYRAMIERKRLRRQGKTA